jgi:hypothetical protein
MKEAGIMKKSLLLFAVFTLLSVFGACTYIKNSTERSNNNIVPQEVDYAATTLLETGGSTTAEPEGIDTVQQVISGSFAIRNVKTGKNLRPRNAGVSDGNDIILYPHNKWKCLTWQFNHIEGTAYQLQNLYTGKTFEPLSDPETGVALWQQRMNKDNGAQSWEFIEQQDGIYLIRLKDTELYITVSSSSTNSPIILMPYQNSNEQQWKLIEQYPTV